MTASVTVTNEGHCHLIRATVTVMRVTVTVMRASVTVMRAIVAVKMATVAVLREGHCCVMIKDLCHSNEHRCPCIYIEAIRNSLYPITFCYILYCLPV